MTREEILAKYPFNTSQNNKTETIEDDEQSDHDMEIA